MEKEEGDQSVPIQKVICMDAEEQRDKRERPLYVPVLSGWIRENI